MKECINILEIFTIKYFPLNYSFFRRKNYKKKLKENK